jgi:hypothetical protein
MTPGCHVYGIPVDQVMLTLLLQDLEDWADDAVGAFPQLSQLQLIDVSLDTDCVLELQHAAPELLHGLKGLQVCSGRRAADNSYTQADLRGVNTVDGMLLHIAQSVS